MDVKEQASDDRIPLGAGRYQSTAMSVAVGWVVVFVSLIWRSHSWKVGAIEAVVGLTPILVGGGIWLRGRRAALEEARQARSPMNLP